MNGLEISISKLFDVYVCTFSKTACYWQVATTILHTFLAKIDHKIVAQPITSEVNSDHKTKVLAGVGHQYTYHSLVSNKSLLF